MRTVTLEEHLVTRDFIKATDAYGEARRPGLQAMRDKLLDGGEGRLASMDEAGIDMQVLSLAAVGLHKLAPSQGTAVLHDMHDELAAAVLWIGRG